jgi:hypothetical protein
VSEAFRLYDYRLFCTGCPRTADVRAIDEEDAVREAKRKIGFSPAPEGGLICGDCVWRQKLERDRQSQPTTNEEYL